MRNMTRDDLIEIFKEMIREGINTIGRGEADPSVGLENLLIKVYEKWPEQKSTLTSDKKEDMVLDFARSARRSSSNFQGRPKSEQKEILDALERGLVFSEINPHEED